MVDDFYGELMHRMAKLEARLEELEQRADLVRPYGPVGPEPLFGPPPQPPPPFPLQPSWLEPHFFVCPGCHKLVAEGHICVTCTTEAD